MAHIIVTGATGTSGSAVLVHALASPAVQRITILSRRPVALAASQPKAKVIIHKDYAQYPPELLAQLGGATACIWAQGISSRGMQEKEYSEITVDYPLAAAKTFAGLGEKMNFVHVSGEGANMSGTGPFMFGRVKGRAETALLEEQKSSHSLRVYNVRPATIAPQGKYTADRDLSMQDRVVAPVAWALDKVWKNAVIPADKLAAVLVDLALSDGEPLPAGGGIEAEGRLVRNSAVRRLAGM
ncbi:unnamed protein product [Zymoseptoria tritici ST99CH_3D1]|nr:unnamed protein product [Zymoseptoria tritici ST99CH_3D1]